MRVAAVVANLFQMVIVLFVFVLQGISIEGSTIAALFCLFVIACFNLLVLLFTCRQGQGGVVNEKKAIIKRRDFRVGYASGTSPRLGIGEHQYELLDISEGGARIAIGRHERLKKRLRCQVILRCGEKLNLKAVLIRREGNEAALAFQAPVEYRTLVNEKKFITDT